MMQPKIHTFEVMGKGEFPFDMLRYDQCWPVDGDSAAQIPNYVVAGVPNREVRTIRFNSLKRPTIDRWSSFLWGCKEIDND